MNKSDALQGYNASQNLKGGVIYQIMHFWIIKLLTFFALIDLSVSETTV